METEHVATSQDQLHARWESEHGHWLKDIRNWDAQHERIRSAIASITRSLDSYDDQIKEHLQKIQAHRQALRIEEDAKAYRLEHPQKIKAKEGPGLDQFAIETHEMERTNHAELMELHEKLNDKVLELVDKMHLSV